MCGNKKKFYGGYFLIMLPIVISMLHIIKYPLQCWCSVVVQVNAGSKYVHTYWLLYLLFIKDHFFLINTVLSSWIK